MSFWKTIRNNRAFKSVVCWFDDEAGSDKAMDRRSEGVDWLRVVPFLFLHLACFAVIYLEIRRPRVKAIRVQKVSGGDAVVAVESIAKRLTYHIDQLADVISVKPKISARGGGVEVEMEVEISPEIDIPMKDEEIRQVAANVVEEQMGLKLRKIRPSFKDGPYPKLPG